MSGVREVLEVADGQQDVEGDFDSPGKPVATRLWARRIVVEHLRDLSGDGVWLRFKRFEVFHPLWHDQFHRGVAGLPVSVVRRSGCVGQHQRARESIASEDALECRVILGRTLRRQFFVRVASLAMSLANPASTLNAEIVSSSWSTARRVCGMVRAVPAMSEKHSCSRFVSVRRRGGAESFRVASPGRNPTEQPQLRGTAMVGEPMASGRGLLEDCPERLH